MTDSVNLLLAGNESRVGTTRWWGNVVLGRDAIFIFQEIPARGRKFFIPFELLADYLLPRREIVGGSYAEIPQTVRTDAEWPVRDDPCCPVLIVPRSAVKFIHHRNRRLEARFYFSGIDIAIPHGRFGDKRLKTFLAAAGWPLIWNGELINIPSDSGVLLATKSRGRIFPTPWISVATMTAGFVIAAVPMLLYLVPRMDQNLLSDLYGTGWILGILLIMFGAVALRRGI
jgi:hypothetical protein